MDVYKLDGWMDGGMLLGVYVSVSPSCFGTVCTRGRGAANWTWVSDISFYISK